MFRLGFEHLRVDLPAAGGRIDVCIVDRGLLGGLGRDVTLVGDANRLDAEGITDLGGRGEQGDDGQWVGVRAGMAKR